MHVSSVDVPTENHFLNNGALLAEITKRLAGREAEHCAEMPAQAPSQKDQRAQRGWGALDHRNGSRMPRLNQCQQRRAFSRGDQLLSYLEGHYSTHTKAHQTVRPAGLNLAYLTNEIFGHRLD